MSWNETDGFFVNQPFRNQILFLNDFFRILCRFQRIIDLFIASWTNVFLIDFIHQFWSKNLWIMSVDFFIEAFINQYQSFENYQFRNGFLNNISFCKFYLVSTPLRQNCLTYFPKEICLLSFKTISEKIFTNFLSFYHSLNILGKNEIFPDRIFPKILSLGIQLNQIRFHLV